MALAMSSLRLFAIPVCALLLSTACGRTEAVFIATGADTGGDTWSYEDTTTPEDLPGWETIADEDSGTDDWMTGEWGEDDPDTWGDTTDSDTFDTDTLDTTDVDTFDTNTDFDTSTDVDTFDTDTDTVDTDTDTVDTDTDTTDTDTTDTNTDTTDTNTDTATDTNTDTATDTFTDTNTDTATDTFTDTDTNTDTTDTSTTDTGGDTCADGAACIVDCGDFSGMCINPCTAPLPDDQANLLFDLQICAIQSCFFLGQCQLGDFNSPECIQCRLDVNVDPASMGCGPEGMACGI